MFLRRFSFIGILILSTILFTSLSDAKDCETARRYFDKAQKRGGTVSDLIEKEKLYREAIRLCPSYAEAYNNLGDVYENQGRFEEAISQYKKVIKLRPAAPYPYFGLGDIYYKTNRPAEALTWYEKGLNYDPGDTLTRKRLAFLKDIQKGSVISAETIRGMLATTRGPGEVVSITFGEGLIPFDFDRYNIRLDAKAQLNEIGKAFRDILTGSKAMSTVGMYTSVIEIAGHTDNRGTDGYNLTLSRRRAKSVVNYLVKNFNIPRDRLRAVGYGERVPLCSTRTSEACHALNRRVEIVKRTIGRIKTRSFSYREPKIVVDAGFFYQRSGGKFVEVLKEESRLRSRSDRYFIFFRPLQDCYAYVLQEDPRGKVDLLFPQKGDNACVESGNDYWVPGFGRAYTLDDVTGEEKLYLLATSWPLKTEIETLSLKERVKDAIRGLKTRGYDSIERPSDAPYHVSAEELNKRPQKIEFFLERVEGEGGWVKVMTFRHE